MSNEYRLSYTAEEIDEKLGKVDNAVLYTPQTLTEEQKAQARANIGAGKSEDIVELQNLLLDKSINLYDATLQTDDTISPHYYVQGFPYETTAFDSSWHCTAPIKVAPNTAYFLTLISDVVETTKPWGEAQHGVFFYRADDSFISGVTTESFTTPAETAYLRFNYII